MVGLLGGKVMALFRVTVICDVSHADALYLHGVEFKVFVVRSARQTPTYCGLWSRLSVSEALI